MTHEQIHRLNKLIGALEPGPSASPKAKKAARMNYKTWCDTVTLAKRLGIVTTEIVFGATVVSLTADWPRWMALVYPTEVSPLTPDERMAEKLTKKGWTCTPPKSTESP